MLFSSKTQGVACVSSLSFKDKEEIFFSQAIKSPVTHVPGADEKISVPGNAGCSISVQRVLAGEEHCEILQAQQGVVEACPLRLLGVAGEGERTFPDTLLRRNDEQVWFSLTSKSMSL